jgi:hypothetical protein
VPGQLADLAVLSADYFSIPEEEIKRIEAVLTMVGGKVVYGCGDYERLAPAVPAASPSWSPILEYGGYGAPAYQPRAGTVHRHATAAPCRHGVLASLQRGMSPLWGGIGCDCFAF